MIPRKKYICDRIQLPIIHTHDPSEDTADFIRLYLMPCIVQEDIPEPGITLRRSMKVQILALMHLKALPSAEVLAEVVHMFHLKKVLHK